MELDEDKIIAMTKLAVYEKKYGKKDKEISKYYKEDYVYSRNAVARWYACFGATLIIIVDMMIKIGEVGIEKLISNMGIYVIDIIIFYIVVVIAYTVINTVITYVEYDKSYIRSQSFISILDKLNNNIK